LDELTPLARTAAAVDAHVGAMVRRRRRALRMSQTRLGEAVGVTFQQIQKYERGDNRISASAMWRIARALRCTPNDFFVGLGGDGALDPSEDARRLVGQFVSTRGGCELARLYLALGDPFRRALVSSARVFAGMGR